MAARKSKKAGGDAGFLGAIRDLCEEKDISPEVMFGAVESALVFAYKKNFNTDQNVEVSIDHETGTFHVYALKQVAAEVSDKISEISVESAKEIDPKYEAGDTVRVEVTPKNFGRIAAQAAKQLVVQKVREAERGMIYNEFADKANDIVNGTVVRIEDGNLVVDIGKAEALLVPGEQIAGETYEVGDRVRAYIAEVKKGMKGAQIFISRTHPGFLRKLFENEVPEIQEGVIEIKSVAREAGTRSKVAVFSNDKNVDAVGSCVGHKGMRTRAILKELGTEKVDIVQWSEVPAVFIANALSPSKVIGVAVADHERVSRVTVPDNQLSLAIGKEGQNARLAAKLTGWKIDIKSESQAKKAPLDSDMHEVDISTSTGFVEAG